MHERKLVAVIAKRRKSVALFIHEAHDLFHKPLVGLKRPIELVQNRGDPLTRYGHNARTLAELVNVRPAAIRALPHG